MNNIEMLNNLRDSLINEDFAILVDCAIKDTGFTFGSDNHVHSVYAQKGDDGMEIWATPGWEDEDAICVQVMLDGEELGCETIPFTVTGHRPSDIAKYIEVLRGLIKKYDK